MRLTAVPVSTPHSQKHRKSQTEDFSLRPKCRKPARPDRIPALRQGRRSRRHLPASLQGIPLERHGPRQREPDRSTTSSTRRRTPIASASMSTSGWSARCASIMSRWKRRFRRPPRPSATSSARCWRAGDSFVCPSRFASDPDWTRVYPHLPYRDAAPGDHGLLPLRRALRPVDGARGSCRLLQAHLLLRADQRTARLSRRLSTASCSTAPTRRRTRNASSRGFPSSSRRRWNSACCSRARRSANWRPLTILPTAKYYREAA